MTSDRRAGSTAASSTALANGPGFGTRRYAHRFAEHRKAAAVSLAEPIARAGEVNQDQSSYVKL